MVKILALVLLGFVAQLVDGSLGMAYGVTSTTLLLAIGTSPAAASATVHLAEIGTTLVSGASHWRFGNVDWKVVARIGVPGAIGAFVGATVLSSLSTEIAAPVMSLILLALGLYILIRFTRRAPHGQPRQAAAQAVPRRRSAWSPASSTPPAAAAGARSAPRDPGQRPDGAAQGDRLDRHQRVPGRGRAPAWASSSPSARRASTSPGSAALAVGGDDRRADRRLAGAARAAAAARLASAA